MNDKAIGREAKESICRHCDLPIRETHMGAVRNEWEHMNGLSFCADGKHWAWPVEKNPLKLLCRLLTEGNAVPVINGVRIEPKPTPQSDTRAAELPPSKPTEDDMEAGLEMAHATPGCYLKTQGDCNFAARLGERERLLNYAIERIGLLTETQANHNWWVKRGGELEASNLVLRDEIERLKVELVEMTQDRNDWASDHEDDCPNKILLEHAEADLAILRASVSSGEQEKEIVRLRAGLASEEASCLEEIKNRDDWEERATNLANAVGEYFEVPVGEHSNINCPIGEAHKILNGEYKTKFTLRASASSEGWIEIKEGCEMPEYGMPVWVIFQGVVQHVAYSRHSGEWVPSSEDGDSAPDGTFTHWKRITPPTTTNTEKGEL